MTTLTQQLAEALQIDRNALERAEYKINGAFVDETLHATECQALVRELRRLRTALARYDAAPEAEAPVTWTTTAEMPPADWPVIAFNPKVRLTFDGTSKPADEKAAHYMGTAGEFASVMASKMCVYYGTSVPTQTQPEAEGLTEHRIREIWDDQPGFHPDPVRFARAVAAEVRAEDARELEALRSAIKAQNDAMASLCEWHGKNGHGCEAFKCRGRDCPDCPRDNMIEVAAMTTKENQA